MTKELWLNLPVKDIDRTKDFFNQIGFTAQEKQPCPEMCGFHVGEKQMSVMFVEEEMFKMFSQNPIADTKTSSEILISFDAESRDEIDETARKVFEAGGTIFSEPQEIQGWMYGFAFADLDGHRWNQIFMDLSQMPQA